MTQQSLVEVNYKIPKKIGSEKVGEGNRAAEGGGGGGGGRFTDLFLSMYLLKCGNQFESFY